MITIGSHQHGIIKIDASMTLAGYIDGELAHEDASWSGLLKDRKITKERFGGKDDNGAGLDGYS